MEERETTARRARQAGVAAESDADQGGLRGQREAESAALRGRRAPSAERNGSGEDSFGELLRAYRERAGLSQNALARASGVDPGSVNRLESGKREPAGRSTVRQLVAALSLAREEGDHLLRVAGHLPSAFDAVAPTDPIILLVADILGDPTLSRGDQSEFRLLIALAARRWRPGISLPALSTDG